MADSPRIPSSSEFELPGAFFLGRGSADGQPLLLRSKDLTTHAVILGQTGSGKTGLAVALLEEAALDQIPAIIIDPKGDLANLMLHFPELRGEDFLPWIDPTDAERKGMEPEAYAEKTAADWRAGIAQFGQDAARIAKLRDSAEYCVYTPGSTAGIPISLLSSLQAPDAGTRGDSERFGERVAGTASSLLALLNIDGDPLTDKRHIFLANLFQHAWSTGQNLGLEEFIRAIQTPPFARVGLLPLDDFFNAKERSELALAFNNLIAAPNFQVWLEGEALDIASMLTAPDGKPRHSIFSIAHLSDSERMFFVSLLLEQVIGWMRQQGGTSSLRALIYMDEVYGYLPPSAMPPSKRPMLTLLKQARAFGVGVVVVTQNPVDLDYKALSNAGTWMIGRLQTERDVDRVIDGLSGAGSDIDAGTLRQQLAGLPQRRFLLHRAGEEPLFFDARWVLNFLAGPMTRENIRALIDPVRSIFSGRNPVKSVITGPDGQALAGSSRPLVPNGVEEAFAPLPAGLRNPVYYPYLLREARYQIDEVKYRLNIDKELFEITPLNADDREPDWSAAKEYLGDIHALSEHPEAEVEFASLPDWLNADALTHWKKEFSTDIYSKVRVTLWHSEAVKLSSGVGEVREDFLGHVRQNAHEVREAAVEKAIKSLRGRLRTAEDQVARAEMTLRKEKSEKKNRFMDGLFRLVTTLGTMFLGGSKLSVTNTRSAGTAVRGLFGNDPTLERAEESLEKEMEDVKALQGEIVAATTDAKEEVERALEDLQEIQLGPNKSDIRVKGVSLLWMAE